MRRHFKLLAAKQHLKDDYTSTLNWQGQFLTPWSQSVNMPLKIKSEGTTVCDIDRATCSLEELFKQLIFVSKGIFSVSFLLCVAQFTREQASPRKPGYYFFKGWTPGTTEAAMAENEELKVNSGKYFWVNPRHLPSGIIFVRAEMPGAGEVICTCLCHFSQGGLKRTSGGFCRGEGIGQSTGLLFPFWHCQVQPLLWVGKILLTTSIAFTIKP